jgi:hypothetical protein
MNRQPRVIATESRLGVGQVDLPRRQVLLQVLQRKGARYRQHRSRPSKEPREADLCRRDTVLLDGFHEREIVVAVERRKRDERDNLARTVVDDLVPPRSTRLCSFWTAAIGTIVRAR